jgi:FXSXX-COOH protein
MKDKSDDFGDSLIDVSQLSLRDLDEIGESSLAHALRQVLSDEPTGPVAGFQSKI